MNIERMLRAHNQVSEASPRILELNPDHVLVKNLGKLIQGGQGADFMEDAAYLLLDQARILEGEAPADTKAFTRRFSEVMVKALAA
jgi:molecular chaperone HtpG